MTPTYEPRTLPRIVMWLLTIALTLGTLMTLIGLTGAAILIWQAVIA